MKNKLFGIQFMKVIFSVVAVLLVVLGVISYFNSESDLDLIRSLTGYSDSRVVWSDGNRNFTYWNNDQCVGVIVVSGGLASYRNESYCSSVKLTKD